MNPVRLARRLLLAFLASAVPLWVHAADGGKLAWAQSFGAAGSGGFFANAIAQDAAGNTAIACSYDKAFSFAGSLVTHFSGYNMCVAKFSSTGTPLWAKGFGGPDNPNFDGATAVGFDSNGDLFMAGWFSGTVNFAGTQLTSDGPRDLVLLKFSGSTGALLWPPKKIGGTGEKNVNGLAVDPSGNVVLVGDFYGTAEFSGTGAAFRTSNNRAGTGVNSIFAAKYSASNGALLWVKVIDGNGYERGRAVAIGATGNIAVAGSFMNGAITIDSVTISNSGRDDIFVAKLAPDGTRLWAAGFGGALDESAVAVAVDGGDNVLLTGIYNSAGFGFGGGTPALAARGGADIFIAKLSGSTGAPLWSKGMGSVSDDNVEGMGIDSAGNIVIAGAAPSAIDLGGGPRGGAGAYDSFLAKYSASGGALWSRSLWDGNDDLARAAAMDLAGNVTMAGRFGYGAGATIDVGGATLSSLGGYDIYVARYLAGTDTVAPSAQITYPGDGSTITGLVTALTAHVTDNVAAGMVVFKVDGKDLGVSNQQSPSDFGGALNTSGLANGAHVITAVAWDTSGNSSTSTPVTVMVGTGGVPVLKSISLTPAAATIQVGGTQQFAATARDQFNNVMSNVVFVYSSTNAAVASVNASGRATALAAGTAGIYASSGAIKSGMAVLTAQPAFSPCDVNRDSATNVLDLQSAVNMALGVAACTADINLDGVCNVVDVQRVVNAALGQACVSP